MKRYRIFRADLDSRPALLSMEIKDTWELQVQEQHRQSQQEIREGLLRQYGELNSEVKIKNFVDLGNKPFSILAFHNKFLHQVRQAFIVGAYYPALTGTCALGERILNHLILKLRDSYRTTPEYKKIYSKNSFDDWNNAIEILENWNVLLPYAVLKYQELAEIRNRKAIHFNPETDVNDRELALESLILLSEIIAHQFSAFGPQPWFITHVLGECYIKKEWETKPFIRLVYLPNCLLVGPYHVVESFDYATSSFIVRDESDYEVREISDEEFAELRNAGKPI